MNIQVGVRELSNNTVKRSYISYLIEQSLFELGGDAMLIETTFDLKQKFDATINDCYEHPEYLHSTLSNLYGENANKIIKKIHSELNDFTFQEPISVFIEKIST